MWLFLAALTAVAAGSGIGYRAAWRDPVAVATGWRVRVNKVQHAPNSATGLVLKKPGKPDLELTDGAEIPANATVATDAHTRAKLEGIDGTLIAVDTDSELSILPGARALRLERGVVLADVAHIDHAPPMRITTPHGDVSVLGTKLEVTCAPDRTHVEVLRGLVSLSAPNAPTTDVLAGQEAVASDAGIDLAPAGDLAQRVAFGEKFGIEPSHNDDADAPIGGLGELRARKPGSQDEKDHALRLARHAVKVRVVGGVARTEIDETFANDSDESLEGVYRFPLPAGAQIERLALEVDDKLVEGAFVDRTKGQAIWRGAIQNATPTAPKPVQEIFWVPGPWRDPALLEWQRGGRFELKIFPIQKRASRRVVIAYTENIAPVGGRRRYVYPLPNDPKLAVDDLFLDVQVLGNDPAVPVRVRGYELDSSKVEGGVRLSRDLGKTSPSGDLTVEYALPDARSEMSAWAFSDTTAKSGADRFALVALRPKLATWGDTRPRDYVIVVDSGRAMFGERFKRASRLAEQITEEMDRRDRVSVIACDVECTRMPGGLKAAGSGTAHDVDAFLASITQDGASDLGAAIRSASSIPDPAREGRVVLLSAGTASAGYRSLARLSRDVADVTNAHTSVVTVPIGSDADTTTLAEIARGGGGAMVPYAPGEPLEAAALEVLAATYGKALRDVRVTLPAGLADAAPKSIAPIRAGSELLIGARMKDDRIKGDVVLTGTLAGEPFTATYPLDLTASTAVGNAFVPREFAALEIADEERRPGDLRKAEMVALSRRFSVPSKYTSLLVLESEAMFSAFGIDRTAKGEAWNDEALAVGTTLVGGDADEKDKSAPLTDLLESKTSPFASSAGPGFGGGHGLAAASPTPTMTAPTRSEDAPTKKPAVARAVPWGGWDGGRRRGQFMKRVFHREANIAAEVDDVVSFDKIADARAKAAAAPDERQRTLDLVRVLERAGDEKNLSATIDAWQKRDPLDDAAISARSDLLAMTGDRAGSLRVRSGLNSALRSPDPFVLDALAVAFEREHKYDDACSMRIAAAEATPEDDDRVSRAIACERGRGRDREATAWLDDVGDTRRAIIGKFADARRTAPTSEPISEPIITGDIIVDATWSDAVDLDLAIIDPNGSRVGWTSSARFAKVADATSLGHETLAVTNGNAGAFTVEIARADGAATDGRDTRRTVHGTLTIRAFGEKKTVPFDLVGGSVRVAKIQARWESELAPATEDEINDTTSGTLPFDRARALRSLSSVSVSGCHDPQGGGAGVALVTFSSSGRVASVTARGGPFSPSANACITGVFRSLTVSPFSGPPETVSRSIVVGP